MNKGFAFVFNLQQISCIIATLWFVGIELKRNIKTKISMDDNTRRTLQLLELKILLEVKRICVKYNIKYFLDGGTLLGAVRHHGFIPWDDDIDIGMKRDEYEKFLNVAETELGPEYFLQTSKTDCGFASSFAKIRLIGTEYKEPVNWDILTHHEIWIDVFPYDNVPNRKVKREIHALFFSLISYMYLYKFGYYLSKLKNPIRRIGQIICAVLSRCVSKNMLFKLQEWMIQAPNKHPSDIMRPWPFKPRSSIVIDSSSTLEFEGFQFSVPSRYHEFLTQVYGDYMQLPPENERMGHTLYGPKFGKYAYVKTIDDIL